MKILISGCSFTAPPIKNSPETQKSIPDYLPGEVERYSERGAGNIYREEFIIKITRVKKSWKFK